MIFDVKNLEVDVYKKFDGQYNYFNPSHSDKAVILKSKIIKDPSVGTTIFRRESKYEGNLLVSDIVDEQDNIILQHNIDDNYLWSYEDARFINETEISVCCCKRDKHDLLKIINVEYKKYNLLTKQFTNFKTQNAHFEKHWQFYNNKIIYHINPFTILDHEENVIYKKFANWQPWIDKYGDPRLSTNIFEVDSIKYLIFHSSLWVGRFYYKYFVGLLQLNNDITPLAYTYNPLFEASREYSDNDMLNDLWNWRKTELCDVVKYEVIFPMNVIVDNLNINIYAGINDCSATNIKIDKNIFIEKIKNQPFILL